MKNRTPCHHNELLGETVAEVLSPHTCPAISDLRTYGAYALRMHSGKVFAVTTCMGEVCFSRCLPDAEPVPVTTRIMALELEVARMRDTPEAQQRSPSQRKRLDSAVRSLQNAAVMVSRWLGR